MAVTRHKLVIGEGQTAGQAVSYLADPQAAGDYYSEDRRALMVWSASSRARAELGLGDVVELSKVERLLNGQHPVSGQLLRWYGPTKTMVGALDITVSPAPKSVSILWALAPPEVKRTIEDMVLAAVAGAVGIVTRYAALVRERYGPGKNDVREIKANDVVGLQVLHSTARVAETRPGIPDPQLHVHALQFGDLREDGRLRAIESRLFLQQLGVIDGDAQAALAHSLEKAGFEIERTPVLGPGGQIKRMAWEVKGIPHSLIKAMSGRSQEISDLARQYRETTGREAIGSGWERFVTNRRGAKSKASAEELAGVWAAEAEEHGLGAEEVALMLLQAHERARQWTERTETSPEAQQLRQEILASLTREHALVPERQLNALALKRAVGLLSPYMAEGVVTRMFTDGELIRLQGGQVTTLEVLAQEQRAERALKRLLEAEKGPAVEPERLQAEFDQAEDEGRPFDPEQRQAIALATSGAHFVSIAGPAGTGKGWASHAMTRLWHEQGRRVIALAVAGRTTQQARADSGADLPLTINALEYRTERGLFKPQPTDVFLVDEAAMIDHQRYATPLEVAARAGATMVQVGDDHQLNPVGPGGLWTIFHNTALDRGLAVELRQVHRTRDPAEAQAWSDLRHGRIEEALSWYRDVGHLRLYDTRQELREGMVAAWWELNPAGVMLVDTSNAERDALNRLAQHKRLEAGELGQDVLTLANGREVRVGDRVITSEHSVQLDPALNSQRGPRIENGTMATVLDLRPAPTAESEAVASEPARLVLELQEPSGPRTVQVDATIPLELGYARHVMKGQGMTAAREAPSMDAALSGTTSQQQLYTLASRSREGTRLHLLRAEVEELGVDVKELEAEGARTQLTTEPELEQMELPVPEAEEASSLRMFNQAELRLGQVVSFSEALPLRQPSGVELGELGVVESVHRGGPTWDFARVRLVGGREVNVYQPDLVEHAPPEIGPEAVYGQAPRADQRDPYDLGHLPLESGQILARGDQVRMGEASGQVVDVERHAENRAVVELSSGVQVSVYATSQVEITATAEQVAAEAAAARVREVEQATIREAAERARAEGPKRAIGSTPADPLQEVVAERQIQRGANQETRATEGAIKLRDAEPEHRRLAEQEAEPEPAAEPEQAAERLREAARESQTEPEPEPGASLQAERESHSQADQARELAHQEATRESAGEPAPDGGQPQAEMQLEAAP